MFKLHYAAATRSMPFLSPVTFSVNQFTPNIPPNFMLLPPKKDDKKVVVANPAAELIKSNSYSQYIVTSQLLGFLKSIYYSYTIPPVFMPGNYQESGLGYQLTMANYKLSIPDISTIINNLFGGDIITQASTKVKSAFNELNFINEAELIVSEVLEPQTTEFECAVKYLNDEYTLNVNIEKETVTIISSDNNSVKTPYLFKESSVYSKFIEFAAHNSDAENTKNELASDEVIDTTPAAKIKAIPSYLEQVQDYKARMAQTDSPIIKALYKEAIRINERADSSYTWGIYACLFKEAGTFTFKDKANSINYAINVVEATQTLTEKSVVESMAVGNVLHKALNMSTVKKVHSTSSEKALKEVIDAHSMPFK